MERIKKYGKYGLVFLILFMIYVSLGPGFIFILPAIIATVVGVSLPYTIFLLKQDTKKALRFSDYTILIFPHIVSLLILVHLSGWIDLNTYDNSIYSLFMAPLSFIFVPFIAG